MKRLVKLLVLVILFLSPFACQEKALVQEDNLLEEKIEVKSASNSKTVYGIDSDVLEYFQHYCQRNAGPALSNYPNATGNITKDQSMAACGPTSYMMVSYCIANYINQEKICNVSGSKLARIIKKTGVSTYLTELETYADDYDGDFLDGEYNWDQRESRSATKKFIQNALDENKFIIVAINANTYNYNVVNSSNLYYNSSKNPDLNDSGSKSNNYVSIKEEKKGSIAGHIIIITKVTIDNDIGTGIVEYIDPLSKTKSSSSYKSNRRYVSYTRLLNSMSVNGDSPNYDALSVGQW